MNLQEILTYVEELSFKNAMFNGYDKDEVDIQLDKICDEVEALVTEKDKEIDDLKAKLSILLKDSSISSEELAGMFASESEDSISREEYDAVVEECAQLKVALEKAELAATANKDDEEAVKLLVGEIEAAKARAAEAEAATAAAKEELAALKAELQAWQEAEVAKEEIQEVSEVVVEEAVPVKEEVKETAASTDEAYAQYMRYADLLCKQLAEVETKHEKIVDAASVEADQIRAAAQAEADQLIADAQGVFDVRNAEAKEEAQGIVDAAKEEAEEIVNKAKADADAIGQEYIAQANAAKEQCEELIAKKASIVASLSGFGQEIAALISKVQEEE